MRQKKCITCVLAGLLAVTISFSNYINAYSGGNDSADLLEETEYSSEDSSELLEDTEALSEDEEQLLLEEEDDNDDILLTEDEIPENIEKDADLDLDSDSEILLTEEADSEENCEIDGDGTFEAGGSSEFDIEVNSRTGAATITAYTGTGSEVTIPDKINGHKVTTIGHKAFAENTVITSVVIPDTVTAIKNGAFYKCTSLSDVVLPKKLYEMACAPIGAFQGCLALTEITIPKSLTLTKKFNQTGSIFKDSGLKTVIFEEGTTTITDAILAHCDNLEEVVMPGTVTRIQQFAFYNCPKLRSVELPQGLISIGKFAFAEDKALVDPVLPDSVTSIGTGAFQNCNKIKKITLPKSLVQLDCEDYGAFQGCSGISSINIPKNLKKCQSWANVGSTFKGTALKTVSLENGLKVIPEGMFANCTGISKMVLPDSVAAIEKQAFAYASKLTIITIPASVKSIDDSAFYKISGLTIQGAPGSYAEKWAGEKGFTFAGTLPAVEEPQEPHPDIPVTPVKKRISLSKAKFKIDSVTYTGTVQVPTCKVTYKASKKAATEELVEGTDYTISVSKSVGKGTRTITFTGIGRFKGKVSKNFKIVARSFSKGDITLKCRENSSGEITGDLGSFTYVKNGTKPKITLEYNGKTLTKEKDYSIKYANHKKAGGVKTPTLTVTGKGNFSGKFTRTFTITKSDIKNFKVTVKDTVSGKKPGKCKPSVKIYDTNGARLVAGTDYKKTMTYTYLSDTTITRTRKKKKVKVEVKAGDAVQLSNDVIPVGTKIKVAITGRGNYEGILEATFLTK